MFNNSANMAQPQPLSTEEAAVPAPQVEEPAKPEETKPEPVSEQEAQIVPAPNTAPQPRQLYRTNSRQVPTLFGDLKENNVVFCVDTSGSMLQALDVVKEHLVDTLMQRAEKKPDSKFNIIEFSSEVTQWSDRMVRCTQQTVAVAAEWIRKIEPKTSTNTLEALLSGFSDQECEAVCLVTDGYPDQNPTDILDGVAQAAENRPVHCFFIEQGSPDPSATEFLQDLAMETYGSFHVIALSLHGTIERVTPVYRAEMSAERIVRTTEGNIYPSNHKICSVGTTLNTPVVVEPHVVLPYSYPFFPYHLHHNPYYGYPAAYYYPTESVGWSRYRPARAALNQPAAAFDDYVPGAGSMLIGAQVLARRNTDGYFYVGKVKSQILSHKFLVEFGPCKHGKYKDTVYQETFLHDIVSRADALRHSVLTGDKVLAPWEAEGERYGPGVVIDGQEKRVAAGGGPDKDLIVSFSNGKSATVPRDTAVWVPHDLHERISFELQLPKKVRCELAEKCEEGLPAGYPTSGPKVNPQEFEVHEGWIPSNDPVRKRAEYMYNPYYAPFYPAPVYYRTQPTRKDPVDDSTVPGTELTKDQLNEKVMSQLMQHKMILEGGGRSQTAKPKLLRRRENTEENVSVTQKSLEKSVSFRDPDSDLEAETGDLETRDSGRGSQTDAEADLAYSDLELEDFEEELFGEDNNQLTADASTGTDHPMMYQRKPRRVRPKQPWRYWRQDPTPSLLEPMHEGPYRVGPFEEPMTPIPYVMKSKSGPDAGVGCSTTMAQYTDYLAKYKQGSDVRDSLHMPKPPNSKPEKQAVGRSVSETLHGNMSEADKLAQQRLDYRRRRAIKREDDWHRDYVDGERMKTAMQDQHRDRTSAQLAREDQRHHDNIQRMERLREARKEVNEQLRSRISENQAREAGREEQRLAALRARRERMEDIRRQRQGELDEAKARKQLAHREKLQSHWDDHAVRVRERESQDALRDRQAHAAKIHRREQFIRRENEAIARKQQLAENAQNRSAVFHSRVFP